MALIVDANNVGYNVQEICNRLDTISDFVASFNQVYQTAQDAAASTTTAETALAYLKYGQTVTKLLIVPTGAVTASDSTYATITISKRDGAGGAASAIATLTTKITGGSGNWTAFVPVDMGTITGGTIAAGSVLTWTVAKASTGVQLPALAVFAELA